MIEILPRLFVLSLLGVLASAFLPLIRSRLAEWAAQMVFIMSTLVGALAGFLFLLVGGTPFLGIISFPAVFSTILSIDSLSAAFFTLVCLVSALCGIFGLRYLEDYREKYHLPTLLAGTALFVLGMQGVLLAQTSISFFFFWELMSLSSAFLVMAECSRASIKAALFYLTMTQISGAAILGGLLLIGDGSLSIDFINLSAAADLPVPMLGLAFGLFFFGFGSKAGLVPFHAWLPEAHPQAPSHISALMSGVMLKVALYGFLRFGFVIGPFLPSWVAYVVVGFGLLSALYGVLYALLERDIKRVLAMSSVENMGLLFTMAGVFFLGMYGGNQALAIGSLLALVIHVWAHGLFKAGLFLSAGTIITRTHSHSLEAMGGLAKRMPVFAAFFLVLCLSAAALPPFGTFWGEWMFLSSIWQAILDGMPGSIVLLLIAIIMVCVGGLAIFAMVRLFGISMLGAPRSKEAEAATPAGGIYRFTMAVPALLLVLMGLFAPLIVRMVFGLETVQFVQSGNYFFPPLAGADTNASSPLIVGLALLAAILFCYALRRLWSDVRRERAYHQWDCGQPITPGMEYTATAFSGPIRFFFRSLLRIRKEIVATPMVSTNPWMARRTYSLQVRSIWVEYGYAPMEKLVFWISKQARRLQTGSVQFYMFLLFLALIVSLILAL
ncbi:hypothetical protein HYV73_02090 [Candidatus Uhrbacteria bacterium]|nr:hypothetical protein [Candidatus Uhrbacteria bacterium]